MFAVSKALFDAMVARGWVDPIAPLEEESPFVGLSELIERDRLDRQARVLAEEIATHIYGGTNAEEA